MSTNSCKLVPDAPNGKPSILFTDIQRHVKSRDAAKQLWGFTQTDLFKTEYGNLNKDENGEPTYEALSRALGLDDVFSKAEQEMNKASDMGLIDSAGNPKSFEDARVAMDRAEEYNTTAVNTVCVVRKEDDGKYRTHVEHNTALLIAEADRNETRRNTNKGLINFLQSLGFNVDFADDPSFDSVFDPMLAEKNSYALRTVIRLAKGERGYEALPEEVAHLVIAGLKDHVLKKRLDSLFTDDVVRRVLGAKYNEYVKKYKNGKMNLQERLREEAEGQVLGDILAGRPSRLTETVQKPAVSLIRRLWNAALSLFRKANEEDIDNIIVNAEQAARDIASLVESRDINSMIDTDAIMEHEKMYELVYKFNSLEQMANDGEILLSKKLYIQQQTQATADTQALRKSIQDTRNHLMNEEYQKACYRILRTITADIAELNGEVGRMGRVFSGSTNLNAIMAQAGLVSKLGTACQAYLPYLEAMENLPELVASGEIDMDPVYAEAIAKNVTDALKAIRAMKRRLRDMRFKVLEQLVKLYYGDHGKKPSGFVETDKFKWESADMILSHAKREMSWWDTNLFSAGDSRNPLMNVIHKIVVSQQAKRNTRINKLCAKMQEADYKLRMAGHDNNFVYQVDENGVPTGYYESERDFAKYEKERQEFVESLDSQDLDYYEKQDAIEKWEEQHLEPVPVGEQLEDGSYRIEMMPKMSLYQNKNFQVGWTKAQKDYYNALMQMKDLMDEELPEAMRTKYLAPQVRKSTTQMFDKGGRGAIGTMFSNWKKEYALVDDNEDYGKDIPMPEGTISEEANETRKHVLTDFAGNKVKRVPIYFVHRMKDNRDLSTDATRAMFNYIAMAVNFSEMGKMANAMQLLKQHLSEEYEVGQESAGNAVYDWFRSLGHKYERQYALIGEKTRTVQTMIKYIDRQFFNETKNELGVWKIGKKTISKDILFNIFMKITSVGRMGFNILSGITNVTQGETQMICESASGKYWGIKDFVRAKAEYHKLLFSHMGHYNDANRHDKMFLLINTFNSSEDFFTDVKSRNFNKSAFKRVLGKGNVYFINSMGEHYLHTTGMLSVLMHEKVIRASDPERKEVSLYDVLEQVHDENGWHLELKEDIEFVDKTRSFLQDDRLMKKNADGTLAERQIIKKEDRDALFENLSLYINNINASLHGGYSEAERGNNNTQAIWRAILQFRQWMFGMYNKNFAGRYYDAVQNKTMEGGFRVLGRWCIGVLQDIKNMGIKAAINAERLTAEDKVNLKFARNTCIAFLACIIMCALTAGWKDEDDRALRLMAYQMKRLKLETGALNPFGFFQNILTLIQSPAAGMSTVREISNLFDLTNLLMPWRDGAYIKSGRFKGWYKPAKALFTTTPLYNITRVVDMKDYNYMFNIFS